jgi:hypothetical protein
MNYLLPSSQKSVRWGFAALLVTLFITLTTSASATVMKFADLAMLVDISDVIVQGKVVKETFLKEKDSGDIVTHTEIEVSRTFLGKTQKKIVFQQWGGIMDGKTSGVPGDARFEVGEEVVLFLHTAKKEPGLFLSALGQSKYRVIRDGKTVNVWRSLADMSFLVEGVAPTKLEAKKDERLGYDSFTAELESLIAAIKGDSK